MTQAMTRLIVETFRLNGELLSAGDQLVADIGLTSARWQVLGTIEMAPAPLPVAHLARNMGLSRQAVQRIANELEAEGLAVFASNPHHARAKLVALTANGKQVFENAMSRQVPWAAGLSYGLSATDLETAINVLKAIRAKLPTAETPGKGQLHVEKEHA
jgi:DNA-binding MarR family transcriptional regulator